MKINKNAFTLIELLAVIVILAIIALIATPIILGIIKDSKESATKLSVENYLRAVELSISNKYVKDPTIDLNGSYNILENGNICLEYANENCKKELRVEIERTGVTSGTIKLRNGKVTTLSIGRIGNKTVTYYNGKIKTYNGVSTLVSGQNFNAKIKQLVNPDDETLTAATSDTTITSIEFYSNGEVPKEIKVKLEKLNNKVDLSLNGDGSIMAYYDDGKVYICSNNLISFNANCAGMFKSFTKVTKIEFRNIDTSLVTSMSNMFQNCSSLTSLDLSSFDTSLVIVMSNMFFGCSSLTELDVSKFDTSSVTTMTNMFYGCSSLTSLDVSNFDTSKVKSMLGMFSGCWVLTTLDVSNFDTSKVTEIANMFNGCKAVTILNVSNFDTSKVTSMDNMFHSCTALTSLDLSNFDTRGVTSMTRMFYSTKELNTIKIGCNWKTAETNTYMFQGSKYTSDQFNTLVEETQVSCPTTD